MNALHPAPGAAATGLPWPDAAGALRFLRRMAWFYGLAVFAVALALLPFGPAWPWRTELRGSGLGGIGLGALLVALTGLAATLPIAAGRARLGHAAPVRWPRWTDFLPRPPADPGIRLARAARRPQGIIVPAFGLAAAACAWLLRPALAAPDPAAILVGGVAIVLTFPLLVAERVMASKSETTLPEAGNLDALLFVPVACVPLAGLGEIGAGLGFGWARAAMLLPAAYLGLVGLELAVRALANWFLPPPAPEAARAAVSSFAAVALRPGRLGADGLATPIRDHLGIDFSRSWALRYARSAALPIAAGLLLLAWGLTGVTLIDPEQRAVYERLGAPVRVWAPGAHLGLPWPLGRVRRLDFGVVHTVLLGGDAPEEARVGAEDRPPPSADRLWNGVHPAEVSYLIASLDASGGQSFQSIDVDLRVLYRIGLDDASAMRAAYAVVAPDALVRSETGQLLAREFAGQTLAGLLGADRETMAEGLRSRLQAELDRFGSGIELVAVVIEAIHPPAGAAEAYHNVQAAEIIANTAISTERGRAMAADAQARQRATGLTDTATGTGADTVSEADVALRSFTADMNAARAGGQAFLLERYFANVATALAKSPLVIVDHRLSGADAPVIDLRSFGAPTARPADDD